MRSLNLILALAGVAAASPAGNMFERAACNADNCLRALRNTKRPGLQDCSSFLQTTVTPATSTIYSTATFFTTPTNTFEVTGTITNLVTATEVLEQTATETVTQGVTVTVRPEKRQVTEIPQDLPTYATPCSGIARYTSACSCLGAVPTTITAETPTTIVTVSETQTPTIIEEYITVQTNEVTVTDATLTVTTTVATQTVVEEVPIATDASFQLKVLNSVRAGQYLSFTGSTLSVNSATTKEQAGRFNIAANGDMSSVATGRGMGFPYSDGYWVVTIQTEPGTHNSKPMKCRITADKKLECRDDTKRTNGLFYCNAMSTGQLNVNFIVYTNSQAPASCTALEIGVEW